MDFLSGSVAVLSQVCPKGTSPIPCIPRLAAGRLNVDATGGYCLIMETKAVGVKALGDNLSRYLKEARAGTRILVLDRDLMVEEIREPSVQYQSTVPEAVEKLVKEGKLIPPKGKKSNALKLPLGLSGEAPKKSSMNCGQTAVMLYIETSAVLRWLFGEPEGKHVVNAAERVLTSTLTVLETERVLIRAVRTEVLTEVKAARLRKLFRDNLRGWELMEITSEIQARAAAPFPVEPVRSLDALHLSTGLSFVEI